MSKFESMSDFEINKLVAEAQGFKLVKRDCGRQQVWTATRDDFDSVFRVPDYCNSWADMGPLLESVGFLEYLLSHVVADSGTHMTTWEKRQAELGVSKLKTAAIIGLELGVWKNA